MSLKTKKSNLIREDWDAFKILQELSGELYRATRTVLEAREGIRTAEGWKAIDAVMETIAGLEKALEHHLGPITITDTRPGLRGNGLDIELRRDHKGQWDYLPRMLNQKRKFK